MSEPFVDRAPRVQSEDAVIAEDDRDLVLQYVVDNVPAWIFWKDRDGVFRGCNRNFAALAGKSDPSEVVGRTDYDLVWRSRADAFRAGDQEVMRRGSPVMNREEVVPDGKNGEFISLTSKVPMRDEAGQVTGILGILVDITERKRMELELGRAKEVAEQAAAARSNFIANVSHELRTPLTLILGPVKEALARPDLTGELRALLESVQRNGFRLYNLVNDVLDFSKADANRTVVRDERVDVVATLAALVDDMRPLALARGLSLELEPGHDALPVALDPKLLERCVLNLVGNALKFTPAGGSVRVALAAEDDRIRVDVADTGIGIAEADLARLFQPFQQLDGSATRKHEGTGLGLVLVKQFAEAMGGSLHAASQLGRGSTFTLHLPRRDPASLGAPAADASEGWTRELGSAAWQQRIAMLAPTAEPATAGDAAPGDADAEAQLPRVLVADDHPDLRAYIARTLGGEFDVVTAPDGLRAWDALQRQRFDAVVSDVMMPELDGVALAARIKGNPDLASVPVILVTARGSSEAAAVGLDAGADDYVVKPFAPEELHARVRAAVRTARLARELRARAREAGMAQVAAGALHNIGNAMNSVNTAVSVVREVVHRSRIDLLEKLAGLLAAECPDPAAFGAFAASDPRGRQLPAMIAALAEQLAAERARIHGELDVLRRHLEHVTAILASQQGVARSADERILTELPELIDEAVRAAGLAAAGLRVEHHCGVVPALVLDPHKLHQLLVNLLANARDALRGVPADARGPVRIRTRAQNGTAVVEVSDDGVGISRADLPHVFEYGFTTKPDGHGIGLHVSALTAAELGGSLAAHSDGAGRGATFTLTLPLGVAQP